MYNILRKIKKLWPVLEKFLEEVRRVTFEKLWIKFVKILLDLQKISEKLRGNLKWIPESSKKVTKN